MHSDLGDGLGSGIGGVSGLGGFGFVGGLGPVRLAGARDLVVLPRVEAAADALLAGYLGVPVPGAPDLKRAAEVLAAAAAVLVVGSPPVGFAQLEVVDGAAHLQQLAVDPAFGRRGLGTALVRGCLAWAARRGLSELTLTTFARVPFNAPFYARMGFTVLDDTLLPAGLAALRRREVESGLDALGRRVAMRALLDLRA